jgi:hypothetical protein
MHRRHGAPYFLAPRTAAFPSAWTSFGSTCFLGGRFPLVFALLFSGS